jgi:hypothetical protein
MEDEPELSDEERELLSEARKHDEAVVLGADEHEALMDEVETAKDAYAEVLAEEWGTDTEKIATNFGIEALREEVEGMTDDEGVDEALTQSPETGDADTDDEDAATGIEALEGDERREAEEHVEVIETLGNPSGGVAEKEYERRVEALAELTGYDSDEVTTEVL